MLSLHVQNWHFLQHFDSQTDQIQTYSECCRTCLSINIRESEKPQIPTADYINIYLWLICIFFHHFFPILRDDNIRGITTILTCLGFHWLIRVIIAILIIIRWMETELFPDPPVTSADKNGPNVARTCHWSPHASASGQWLWHLFGYHDGAVERLRGSIYGVQGWESMGNQP